jgi:hypothetical protein
MDEADALVEHYQQQCRSFVEGRAWIVAADVLVSAVRMGQELKSLGASQVMAVATSRGVGDLPPVEEIPQLDLKLDGATDMMAAIRESARVLADLPDWARAEVDRFDPNHEAVVLENIFSSGAPIAGRPVFGPRHPAWQALEDKMIIDQFWDDAGIVRAPSAIVPVDLDGLWSSHEDLDEGLGTVWVGDNRDGWHGGAKLLRWVRNRREAEDAHSFLGARCDRARVMPFLEGIPCSIHGWVFPDEVIGFRPCEMLVFRVPGSSKLSYAGAGTAWEPPGQVARAMHSAVVRVGQHLKERVGYLGSFTMDGVATKGGFLPTELNPRFGAAIGRMAGSMPTLPLYLLHVATMAGEDLEYRPKAFESLVRQQAGRHPVVRGMHVLEGRFDEQARIQKLCRGRDGWRLAEDEEESDVVLRLGPSSSGSILFASIQETSIRRGPSSAPEICELFAFADALWGLGIGPLEPALDLRSHES